MGEVIPFRKRAKVHVAPGRVVQAHPEVASFILPTREGEEIEIFMEAQDALMFAEEVKEAALDALGRCK